MFNKISHYKIKKNSKGFSLVELVVALGIFAIVSSGVIFVVINSYRTYYGAGDKQVVVQFAQEGLEAVKSIRDNSWQGVVAVADDNDHGVVKTNGLWQFSGTNNTLGALTRTIVISNVSRDTSGNIDAGTNYDPNTKKVIVTVSGSGISNYVLVSFITNWSHRYWEQTDWSGVGTSEFWNSAIKASSSYSNISTATPGALTLALSAAGTPGSYGDWGNIYPLATSTYFSGRIISMALSPDQKTLYTVGGDSPQMFRVYDVSKAKSGIIKELWKINYYSDVMVSQAAGIAVHPSGRYVYVGCYATTGVVGRLILIIDTQTREVSFSTGGTSGGTSMYINDIVVDNTNGYVYGLGRNGRIFPFQMTNNGATLTLVGSSAGQLMAASSLNSGEIVNGSLYIVTSDGPKSFQKINISNPASLSTTTNGYVFANPNGARPRYDLEYIETVAGKLRFLVTNYSGLYEVEIIEENDGTPSTIGFTGLPNSLYFDIADGGIDARTYWLYSYTGDLQEVYINSIGEPSIGVTDCNGRACKYANYYQNATANSDFWAKNMIYSSVLGGLILLEYQGATPSSYNMYFVPKTETRADGATYSYRRAITIDHTKVSTEDQISFPVLISGTYSYLKTIANGGNVQSADGDDIIFTSDLAGTTILDHEVESYSSSTGAIAAWVRIPTLASSSDTTIYMFYGNSAITSAQEKASSVWDSNFKLVLHMNYAGTDSVRNDSTLDNNSLYKYWGDPSTLDIAVSASSDDAQQKVSDGTVTTNGTSLYMGYQNASNIFYTGLRFQNIQIPQNATIVNAYIEFQASASGGGTDTNNTISAIATDDASAFTASNYSISSLTTTTAYTTWRWPYTWTTGSLYRTTDISPLIREVVNRPGWAAGNDMAFRINPDLTNTWSLSAKSYDATPWTSTTSPRLYINYASTTSGVIGGGDYFDNDQDKLLAFANYKSLWQNTSDFTAEFWIKYTSMLSYSYTCILYKGNGDFGPVNEGWSIRVQNFSGAQKLTFHMGNMAKSLGGITMTNALDSGTWYHVAMVVDRDVGYQWYRNGVAEASYATDTSAYTLGTSTAMGISYDWSPPSTTQSFGGYLDEVRISHTKRAASWLLTSFNSQNDPSSFYSVSGATTVAGYASPGTLYSSIIDLGATDQTLASISLDQNIPSGCSIVATLEGSDASSFSSITSADFSDSASFFTSSTPSSLNNKRYLRYKVTLNNCNSGSSAPTLYSLRLNYR